MIYDSERGIWHMVYPTCPECGWVMTEDVGVSDVVGMGLDNGHIIWKCTNPDCDHVEEQKELSIY